jgi:hypothetical protein
MSLIFGIFFFFFLNIGLWTNITVHSCPTKRFLVKVPDLLSCFKCIAKVQNFSYVQAFGVYHMLCHLYLKRSCK